MRTLLALADADGPFDAATTIHLRTESCSLSPTPKRLVLPKGRLDMAVSVKSNEGGPLPLLLRLYEYYFSERVSWKITS